MYSLDPSIYSVVDLVLDPSIYSVVDLVFNVNNNNLTLALI
jgi:hypothetical protein